MQIYTIAISARVPSLSNFILTGILLWHLFYIKNALLTCGFAMCYVEPL